jgi:hypothetical protein
MKDSAPAKSECFEMTSIETKTGPGCALSRITQDVFIPKDEKKEKANTPEVLGEKAGLPASILRKKK